MPSVLITGSNRGLGLEWATQYAEQGWQVHATCRCPEDAADLAALAERYPLVAIYRLDVTKPKQIRELAGGLINLPLNVLVNNAGVYFEHWGKDKLGRIDYADWEESFRVNTLGAVRVTEAFAPHLARSQGGVVVAVTSNMGSLTDITCGHDYAYRSSKAALNASMRGLSYELKALGVGVLLVHPGWVRTRMGGSTAPVNPEESVAGMRALVERFEMGMSGEPFRYDGSHLPW